MSSVFLVPATTRHGGRRDPSLLHGSGAGRIHNYMDLNCTQGTTNVKIALDEGVNAATGSSCDIPQRRLINGTGDFLNYTIHENGYASQGGSVWGCSTLSEASVDFVTSDRNTLHVNLELPQS